MQYDDIRALTEKSPQERNAFVRQHARSVSGNSQRAGSVSSDGIMDEEDEVPFSAANEAMILAGPKQDELPRRPAPGGRFPSDLNISSSRGLQAPLSPSSGSSGEPQDRDLVAAAGSLPGIQMQQYGQDHVSSPTHAAYVNQQAKEDGINPYTYKRMSQEQSHRPEQYLPGDHGDGEGLAAAGLGGAAVGALGTAVYRHHEADQDAEFRKQQEQQAAREASAIAAPDTYNHESEQLAASEAAIYAAPDTDLAPVPSSSQFMSGARSQGDVSTTGAISGNVLSSHTGEPIENALKPLTDLRPSLAAGQNHQSVQSVSQLHIPGEFPKDGNRAQENLNAGNLPV